MNWVFSRGFSLVAVLAVSVGSGACNDVADCPSSSSIHSGESCSGDQLQCPYDLRASDGTTTATSCTCLSGSWSCPTQSADEGGDDGGGGGDDGTTSQESGSPADSASEADSASQSPDSSE